MPVRKIPKTYGSLSGKSSSRKLNRLVSFESSLERDLLALLEFDPNIVHYEEQPIKIEYVDADGKSRSYTPDILIVYRNENVSPFGRTHILGEVKYRPELFSKWKELKPKFKAARQLCKNRGWKFSIFTEVEIRTPYLKNIRFLLPCRNYVPNSEYCDSVIRILEQFDSLTVAELLNIYSANEMERLLVIPYIWQLTAIGKIQADLNLPLNMNSRLWLTEERTDEH
jgi:TnsA endonuclease N terminal/TnsA endonuclease C terminal